MNILCRTDYLLKVIFSNEHFTSSVLSMAACCYRDIYTHTIYDNYVKIWLLPFAHDYSALLA